MVSLVQKMSPPQLYKRGLVLIDELTLATKWSFGSLGHEALTDGLLTQNHEPASSTQPTGAVISE